MDQSSAGRKPPTRPPSVTDDVITAEDLADKFRKEDIHEGLKGHAPNRSCCGVDPDTPSTDCGAQESPAEDALPLQIRRMLREEHAALQVWLKDALDQQRQSLAEQGTPERTSKTFIRSSEAPVEKNVDPPPQPSEFPLRLRDDWRSQTAASHHTLSSVGCLRVRPGRSKSKGTSPVGIPTEIPNLIADEHEEEFLGVFPSTPAANHAPSKPNLIGVMCAPTEEPVLLEGSEDVRNGDVVPTITSQNTALFTDETGGSDEERQEWKRHLQRQMSQQIGKRSFRRAASVKSFRNRSSGRVPSVMKKLVECTAFQWLCGGIIVVNVGFIGFTTNWGMVNALSVPPHPEPNSFHVINSFFTTWYCLELVLRIVSYGREFVTGDDKKWNAFDTCLVVLSLSEEIVQDVDVGIGALRVIRGLRMFRVLRIIRMMRYFRDLRLMVGSILQSLGSLSWALLLLITIMYLFSVVFMQGAVLHLVTLQEENQPVPEVFRSKLQLWYSSVFDTMYTLLASIIGGVSWTDVVRPLEQISLVYRVLFTFYVTFVVIGVLNVLTGIFVERACELSGLDKDLVIQTQMKRNETFLMEMKKIFEECDSDCSGSISWGEFKEYLENDRVKAYLSTQQLDAFDARTLFDIISDGQGEEINVENFLVGCQRLKGIAKSVDVVAVLQEMRSLSKRVRSVQRQLEGGGRGPSRTLTGLLTRRPSVHVHDPIWNAA
uniref:EF-hand domain-containing protein n=1 Tax=Alexandrium monilatum TaxID=311494 RepID=A0A7S4UQ20_9DINO